jgi:geranylgeranylglycerol-phosphate geranylgeranyltransferase
MKTIRAIWELLRLEHGLMYGVGVIIGIYVSDPNYSNFSNVLFGFLTALFLQASAFALNDYLDYEVDLANKRHDRPLVRGDLTRGTALILSLLLMPVGFLFAYLISFFALTLALTITILGYLYDVKLKEFGFAGNIYIALSMAAPFIFGSVVAKNIPTLSATILSLIAFLSGLGREIMKGIEDIEGDAIRDVKTVARLKGATYASNLAAAFFLLSVSISPVPFIFLEEYIMDLKYAVPVIITDIMLIRVSLNVMKHHEKERIGSYRKETLIAMLFGLLGFLLGAF